MNEISDEQLDELLRRDFHGAVSDDGFAARAMRALPARPQHRRWIAPVASIAGGLLACLALSPSPLWQQVAHEAQSGNIGQSSAVLLAVLLSVGSLSCAWALEESQ